MINSKKEQDQIYHRPTQTNGLLKFGNKTIILLGNKLD